MGADQSTSRTVREEADRMRMAERKEFEAKLEKQRKEADRLRLEERKIYEAKLEKQRRELAEQRAKVLLEQQKNNYNLKLKGVETQPAAYSVTLSTSSHHGNQEGYQAQPGEWVKSKLTPPAPPLYYQAASGLTPPAPPLYHRAASGLTPPAPPVATYYQPAVESPRLTPPAPPVATYYQPAVESPRLTPPAPPVATYYQPAVESPRLTPPAPPVATYYQPAVESPRLTPTAAPLSDQATVGTASSRTKHILDELLKCRNCNDQISGLTVFQCRSGHSACEKCRYAYCGVCGGPITEKKHTATIAVEAAMTKLTVPCAWQASGCQLVLQSNDLDLHVKGCPFRDIPCPISAISECSWQGKKSQLASHFQECHYQHCTRDAGTEMYLCNVYMNSQIINLVTHEHCHFLVLVKVDNVQGRLHMAVQLIGTMADAGQYTYEFHMYNKNEPNRKFLLTDVCRSIYTPMNETFHEAKTVSIPLSYAMKFVNNNRICYKFYIQKADGDAAINRKVKRRYGRNAAKRPNSYRNQE